MIITNLDRFDVALATNPADYTSDILEGLCELNAIEPMGFTAKEVADRILATCNRSNLLRVFIPVHDQQKDMQCAGWIVACAVDGFMGECKCNVGPVWVRRGYHGEPLLAIRPHLAKWAQAVGCLRFRTESIRYDKQSKLAATIRAYTKWVEPYHLTETAVVFEGPL